MWADCFTWNMKQTKWSWQKTCRTRCQCHFHSASKPCWCCCTCILYKTHSDHCIDLPMNMYLYRMTLHLFNKKLFMKLRSSLGLVINHKGIVPLTPKAWTFFLILPAKHEAHLAGSMAMKLFSIFCQDFPFFQKCLRQKLVIIMIMPYNLKKKTQKMF